MAIRDITASFASSHPGFNFSNAGYVPDVQAEGSGNYVFSSSSSGNSITYFVTTNPPPAAATLNSLTLVVSARAASGSGTRLFQFDIQGNFPMLNQNSGNIAVTTSFQEYTFLYTGGSLNRFSLLNSLFHLSPGNANLYQLQVEYLAWRVDYTPPPDAYVQIWTAGAYPASCGQPPLKRFKPFGIYNSATSLIQQATADYMLQFGKPAPGYVVWCYWRTISYDLIPEPSSPITTFTIGTWPPPG